MSKAYVDAEGNVTYRPYRESGPSYIYIDGEIRWYVATSKPHVILSRKDGPAHYNPLRGTCAYYVQGAHLKEEDFHTLNLTRRVGAK